MKISKKTILSPQKSLPKPVKKEQPSSWKGYLFKRGLAACALGIALQALYQNTLSPSSYSHQPEMGALQNFCKSHLGQANSLSFRAMQAFLNTFETWGYPYYLTGLSDNEPFGDMQAFALDGNLKALEASFSSYPEGQVNTEMLTELYGRVLRYMDLYNRDLKEVAKWLVKQGANVNHQQRVKRSEIAMGDETSHTALMTAFHLLDKDLYSHFISKGASPAMVITSYSEESKHYNRQWTLFEAITDKMTQSFSSKDLQNQSQKRLKEAYLCPIYKSIVDDSLSSIPKSNSNLPNHERTGVYLDLRSKICQDYFKVTDDDKYKYDVETKKRDLKNTADNIQQTAKSIYDFFTKVEDAARSAAEKYNDLSEEDFEAARNAFKATQDAFLKTADALDSAASVASNVINHPVVIRATRATSNFIQDALPVIGRGIEQGARGLVYITEKSANGISAIYHTDFAQEGGRLALEGGTKLLNVAVEGTQMAVSGIGTVAKGAGQLAYDASQSKIVQGTANFLITGAESGGKLLLQGVQSGGQLLVDGSTKAANLISDVGNSRVVQGALGAAGDAAGAIGNVAGNAAGAIGNAAGTIGNVVNRVKDEVADRLEDASSRKRSDGGSGLTVK